MTTTIGLLGDVMLGRSVGARLAEIAPEALWSGEFAALCSECDAVVCNLECCVSTRGTRTRRVPRKSFFFRAPPSAPDALAAVGVRAASLANNHALDYGSDALLDTIDYLTGAGIATAGAGPDLESARRGALFAAGDLRIGLLAVTDHPAVYAAGHDAPGVAWADLRRELPEWLRAELARLRDEADVVIAYPHWGPNMTTRPADWQRRRARDLIVAGADLVAGHSAHLPHGLERVLGRLALYDLGDALDDYAVDATLRNDLGILALWRPGSHPELELVALRLRFCETGLARGADADWVAARLAKACAELGTSVERVSESRLVVEA